MPVDIQRQNTESRWSTGAWLTLIAAIIFILLNVAQILYRFTIPSLGWAGLNPDDETQAEAFILIEQAVRRPSPIKPGDAVQSIAGIPAREIINQVIPIFPKPVNWVIGELVRLTVTREGRFIEFDVQLVHWTPEAWLVTNFGSFSGVLSWLITLLLFGIGTFTFVNRPGNLAARFLFAFGLANLSITLGDSIPDYIALYFDLPAGIAKAFFSNIVFAYLLAPSFLGFSLTFPHPKKFIKRQPLWLLAPYVVGSATMVLLYVAPEAAVIGFPLTLAMLLLGVVSLIHSGLTMKDEISQAQLRWAIGGVILGAVLFMVNFTSNLPSPYREIVLGIASLGFPIIGLSLAIAILRYHLFDIDVIIRKTLQYTLLTGLLALIYFGSVLILQNLVETLTGEQSPIAIVISTLGIAALFNPLRIRLQVFIDRRFFRNKYDAEQALARFAATARGEVDMDQLNVALLQVVAETMQPNRISLWLKSRGEEQ